MSLKRPVTIAQARQWPAAAARRESFCARMGGMRTKLTSERTARDPRSKINQALAAWDCDVPELLEARHVSKGVRPMKITRKMVGAEAPKASKRKNPAKPTVSRKISQLVREGYPQRQAVAIALEEARQGKLTVDRGRPHKPRAKLRGSKVQANPRLDTQAAKARENPRLSKAQVDRKVAQLAKTRNYTIHGKGGKPVATFYARADAIEYGKAYANLHNVPIHISWEKKK